MKQANYQQAPTNTGKTPSNNENKKKQTTTIKEDTKKLLSRMASARKRTQRYGPETASFQHSQ